MNVLIIILTIVIFGIMDFYVYNAVKGNTKHLKLYRIFQIVIDIIIGIGLFLIFNIFASIGYWIIRLTGGADLIFYVVDYWVKGKIYNGESGWTNNARTGFAHLTWMFPLGWIKKKGTLSKFDVIYCVILGLIISTILQVINF